ncbi:MAG: FAD-dependent oxidoreductase [Clostridiales bacterium]|jgi:NADPH-dependent 2,4-dienoyl-CoA reductase/sulfur reductase-like enzyme/CxxC motif-containing protein|nr:FAD-dependent oxidoreductase [Clostridiales bacterium]
MKTTDLAVIGAGPAGMGAALAARKHGVKDIIILERADKAGGILPQCIHNGFGLHRFREELTGPEYALRFLKAAEKEHIEIKLNSMAIEITPDLTVVAMSRENGVVRYRAKAIVLAMGCRERTRGAIQIPGARPAGVITAGTAQRFVNIEGYMPGKEIVILGSGDVGLIMARRLTLEGAAVKAVCEIMPQSGGLRRNISQCLNDFNIPLLLNTTVNEIHGRERVSGVTIARVDEKFRPVSGTELYIPCDTLMLSVGLIPENELSRAAGVELAENGGAKADRYMRTNVPGIFACGNVVHVHDLVDYVTDESEEAGKNAAYYILGRKTGGKGYTFHQKTPETDEALAVNERRLTCIVCPVGCNMIVRLDEKGGVADVSGNKCKKGGYYAIEEFTAPRRVLTSTVPYEFNRETGFAPVKTKGAMPKKLLIAAMGEIAKIRLNKPAGAGDVIIRDLLGTGADVVLTDDLPL